MGIFFCIFSVFGGKSLPISPTGGEEHVKRGQKMQKENEIIALQRQGYGYRKIATLLGLSPNSVKDYCRRNPYIPDEEKCPQCGKRLVNTPHKREKKFCSDKCRLAWWNSHPELINRKAIYHLTCAHCGKPFDAYGKANKKYCSRSCYADARRKGGNDNG